MADPAMVNAIKGLTAAVKEQSGLLKQQLRLIETMNNNYVRAYQAQQAKEAVEPPADVSWTEHGHD